MPSKPHIEYPCSWEFRLIGADPGAIREAVAHVLGDEDYSLTEANRSPEGRWCSLSLEMQVLNEAHRHQVHRVLREHPDVRMVL